MTTTIKQILSHPAFTLLDKYEKRVVTQLLDILDKHCMLVRSKISELCFDYTVFNLKFSCMPFFRLPPQIELVEITKHDKRYVEEKYFFINKFAVVRLVITKPMKRAHIAYPFTAAIEIYVLSQ